MVAAGLALADGKLRILDASGATVVSDKDVAASSGAYGPFTLGDAVPYRIEACGTVGDRPVCLWGATNTGGTVNLTPLTSAITVLASGRSPETLMSGAITGLTDADLAAAHGQVRNAVAAALAEAGLAGSFDLLAGALTPASHSGQDRVLDAVAVSLGLDGKPYVALGSRFGTGVAYLEPGASQQGSLSLDAAATAGLDLTGLDQLFAGMSSAMQIKDSCPTELPRWLDANARATAYTTTTLGVETADGSGATQSAQVLCLVLGGVLGDYGAMPGGRLLPPVIDRCELNAGTDPVCRVSFVYQTAKDSKQPAKSQLLRPLGIDQAAVRRSDGWKFLGNRLEVQASARARLVLSRRVDAATTPAPDAYARFLDIAIPVVAGLQCARASQKDASGTDVPLAYFKRHGSGRYLSLWSLGSNNAAPSLDAASGATRGADIVALPVPTGAAGDATARNFARAGRALKIELFGDTACSAPLAGADGGAVSVTVAGQLPIGTAGLPGQPWPALAAASVTALAGLKGAAKAAISYAPAWTLPRKDLSLQRAQLCTLDPNCGNKLADAELPGTALATQLSATLGNLALDAKDYKLLRLTGRTADGLTLQLDSASCASQVAGLPC